MDRGWKRYDALPLDVPYDGDKRNKKEESSQIHHFKKQPKIALESKSISSSKGCYIGVDGNDKDRRLHSVTHLG